jgi:hypothetical protein
LVLSIDNQSDEFFNNFSLNWYVQQKIFPGCSKKQQK